MEHLPYALNAVNLAAPYVEPVREKAKQRIDKARGRAPREDPGVVDTNAMEDKGYILRRRSQVQSDEEIVEVVRHKGQVLPRRPRARRQTSSMNGRYRRDAGGYGSDSEGSIPPRSRRATSTSGRSRRALSSSSSSSSSDLGSSTDEENEIKKMKRKKWITGGFAAVATIHAASKVYSSIENHDKRVIAVQQGTMSPEEAHKQARSARWQDAAAIGIAALGIKGAISEWKEMTEDYERHKELCQLHEEHHKKRLEYQRRQRAREHGGYYKGRDGNWYYDGPELQSSIRARARSNSTYDTYDQLAGPRQGERRMVETPPSSSRNGERSRARSRYDRDDDDRSPVRDKSRKKHDDYNPARNNLVLAAAATPFLGYAAYKLTKAELTDEPILKVDDSKRQEYLKQRDLDRHGEYKDLGLDTMEEILEKAAG
ncbi:hypothetical protein LTS08_002483 [Lithohypha guttulata]|nr:hypothetical protein LTS08_002483 [Lithohypha guttulata]